MFFFFLCSWRGFIVAAASLPVSPPMMPHVGQGAAPPAQDSHVGERDSKLSLRSVPSMLYAFYDSSCRAASFPSCLRLSMQGRGSDPEQSILPNGTCGPRNRCSFCVHFLHIHKESKITIWYIETLHFRHSLHARIWWNDPWWRGPWWWLISQCRSTCAQCDHSFKWTT